MREVFTDTWEQEYIEFLEGAEQEFAPYVELPAKHAGSPFGIDHDCPVFPGLFSFCRLYAGASVGIALCWSTQVHDRCATCPHC